MRTVTHDAAAVALADRTLAVVRYGDRYAALSAHLGVDFRAIRAALDGIPLCLRDGAHAAARGETARLIAEGRGAVLEALPAIVGRRLAPLRRPGGLDLLAGALVPLVDDVLSLLTGLPRPETGDSLLSRVFSQSLGVAKRRRLDAEIVALQGACEAAFPSEAPGRRAARLALLILGRDALIGTLALSLHDHLVATEGRELGSRPFPVVPTRTAVPFVDREAIADTSVGGEPVGKGEVVRLALDSFRYGDDGTRQRYFGAGSHLCLGRPLSLALFEEVAAFLRATDRRVGVTRFDLRKDDVFAYPQYFLIEVQP